MMLTGLENLGEIVTPGIDAEELRLLVRESSDPSSNAISIDSPVCLRGTGREAEWSSNTRLTALRELG